MMETIVAIAVASTAILGVIAGFLATSRISGTASDRSRAEAALTVATERVSSLTYRACVSRSVLAPQVAAVPLPAPFRVELTQVAYLTSTGSFAASCPARDLGAQRLTIVVVRAGSDVRVDGQVVLRNPGARP